MPVAESSPVQAPADTSEQGVQEADGTSGGPSAGSRQPVLMCGPAAHFMCSVDDCLNDCGCPGIQQTLQGALVLGSSQASSLMVVYGDE